MFSAQVHEKASRWPDLYEPDHHDVRQIVVHGRQLLPAHRALSRDVFPCVLQGLELRSTQSGDGRLRGRAPQRAESSVRRLLPPLPGTSEKRSSRFGHPQCWRGCSGAEKGKRCAGRTRLDAAAGSFQAKLTGALVPFHVVGVGHLAVQPPVRLLLLSAQRR